MCHYYNSQQRALCSLVFCSFIITTDHLRLGWTVCKIRCSHAAEQGQPSCRLAGCLPLQADDHIRIRNCRIGSVPNQLDQAFAPPEGQITPDLLLRQGLLPQKGMRVLQSSQQLFMLV